MKKVLKKIWVTLLIAALAVIALPLGVIDKVSGGTLSEILDTLESIWKE